MIKFKKKKNLFVACVWWSVICNKILEYDYNWKYNTKKIIHVVFIDTVILISAYVCVYIIIEYINNENYHKNEDYKCIW